MHNNAVVSLYMLEILLYLISLTYIFSKIAGLFVEQSVFLQKCFYLCVNGLSFCIGFICIIVYIQYIYPENCQVYFNYLIVIKQRQ